MVLRPQPQILMIDTDKVEDLIFLSYLTNYNLNQIHKIIGSVNNSVFESEYQKENNKRQFEETDRTTKITIQKLKYYGVEAIPFTSAKYPKVIRKLKDFPPVLYVRGKLKNRKLAAIVGSRNASKIAPGKVLEISKSFIDGGYGIASGLAIGIDTYAHEAAINESGYTVAVLPTSLDTIYPAENFGLANKIIDRGGALLSEIPIGINRGKKSYIERNRLQTALSDFVVPVELGVSSGTMHTVNFCIQQGKTLLLPIPSEATFTTFKEYYEGILFLQNKFK